MLRADRNQISGFNALDLRSPKICKLRAIECAELLAGEVDDLAGAKHCDLGAGNRLQGIGHNRSKLIARKQSDLGIGQ